MNDSHFLFGSYMPSKFRTLLSCDNNSILALLHDKFPVPRTFHRVIDNYLYHYNTSKQSTKCHHHLQFNTLWDLLLNFSNFNNESRTHFAYDEQIFIQVKLLYNLANASNHIQRKY